MDTLGDKIEEIRRNKGMTQEELAILAKVSPRTIQRIENNASKPRGYTLKNICLVLDVPMGDILDYGKEEDLSFLSYFHLSVLTFLILPYGNFIVPTILWLTNRNRVLHLNEQAKNVLNFQINISILMGFSVFVFALLKLEHIDVDYSFLYVYFGLNAINIILVARSWWGIKKGNIKKYFPQIISFIK